MKKISYFMLSLCTLLFSACEDFLDSENLTKKSSENFPLTPADADLLLTGTYVKMTDTYPLMILFYISEIMSDNCLGGGDRVDTDCKDLNIFHTSNLNKYRDAWKQNYAGIFRANATIEGIEKVAWGNNEAGQKEKKRITGESHFLRAYYYFDLVRLFENVPLQLTTLGGNPPQATPEATYAQIALDLKIAIENLDTTKVTLPVSGRVSRWAAEGYMAKVFLFYTGYYRKETLPLPDGSQIAKQQVIDWLVECIGNSGHDLAPDFRSLWPYSYRNSEYRKNTIYNYLTVNNIPAWLGDGNIESVFAVKHTSLDPGWEGINYKTNQIALYYGLRMPGGNEAAYSQAIFPFGRGWGQATVNSKLWDDWDERDLRKKGSILNVRDPDEDILLQGSPGEAVYQYGAGGQSEETGYWNKKYIPINAGQRWAGIFENYSHQLYSPVIQDYMRDNLQDLVIMRFADILLMAAELGAPNAKAYLNRVHQRGIPGEEIEVSLDNIMNERRFELAFEGVRYHDLLRWHREDLITTNQTDIPVWNEGVAGGKVNVVFRPETRGFLPIPEAEIDLSGGVLKPNPGW
jgi:hypothetical protein